MKPYPLQFIPEMKERVWGGRALVQFDFELPEGPIGEAWVIGDHPHGTTKVSNGELAGMGLDQVREQYGRQLFGSKGLAQQTGRFPLLIKLLDCQADLSIQVHPNDDYEGLPEGESGKTEMWYILDAKPNAKIIYGLKSGFTREELAKAIQEDRIMDGLQEVSVSAGDSFYIPSGTVHALGSGVLVAEVQQNSDTVYRLHDYNRLGLDGKPRELHIEDSLNVIAYENSGATRMKTDMDNPNIWLTLAKSPYFIVEKGMVDLTWRLSTTMDTFIIHIICDGTGTLTWENGAIQVKAGDSLLIPANLGEYSLNGKMTVLRSYLP